MHRPPDTAPEAPSPPVPFAALRAKGFEILAISHADAILAVDFPHASSELEDALSDLALPITEIIGSGGGESRFTQRLRRTLARAEWPKHKFQIDKVVDGVARDSTSHEIDHVRRSEKGVIALEIEWNNKDPFFDRDLENFKRLHAEGAISVGVLITRGASLQAFLREAVRRFAEDNQIASFGDLEKLGYTATKKQVANVMEVVTRTKNPIQFKDAWTDMFVGSKYGQATTHWEKLMHRVHRGVGNPCPLLLIGLPSSMVQFDAAQIRVLPDPPAGVDSEPSSDSEPPAEASLTRE